jgi:hypothetical protein
MAVSGGSPSFAALTVTGDATIDGVTVGQGGGNVATNTAVGAGALANASNTGANNAAFGSNVLSVNTSGNVNAGFGINSLAANTTGSNNAGFGVASLSANTTGNFNVACGQAALQNNTTASNNTAVGYQAGYTNTTGAGSTYIGRQAGLLSTGIGNTFVGAGGYYTNGAGAAITTGSKNTILGGYDGNQSFLDMRTLSNHIVLSDGEGNMRGWFNSSGQLFVNTGNVLSQTGIATFVGSANAIITQVGNGNAAFQSTNTSGTGTYYGAIWGNNGNSFSTCGTVAVSGTTTAYNTSSDYRLKEDVQPMTGALAKVALLKPVTYKWKSDGTDGEGFIAHELAEICPNAVTGEKDAVKEDNSIMPQGIDTSFLIATLTAAIQELKAELDTVKAELAALKG